MKIFRKLLPAFLTLTLLPVLLAPVGRGEAVEWFELGEEAVTSDESGADGAELLDHYVENLFGMPTVQLRKRGIQPLTGLNKVIYDRLVPFIQDVASGEITATETTLNLSLSELGLSKYEWSASDLGIASIVENGQVTNETSVAVRRLLGYDISLVIGCLRAEHPYEMYWYDVEYGYAYTYPGRVINRNGAYYVTFDNCSMRFSLSVSQDFAKKGYDENGNSIYYIYRTDPSLARSAVRAAENAVRIVEKNASKSNYGKLNAYRQEISDLSSYNHDAWNNGSAQQPYGNPWQLVWVFDGDPATKVVCEGYAKAFQYLCDQSSFKGNVNCITVNGTESDGGTSGRHAWNIVHMNNGLNYLVDVTICDSASLTEGNWLFMAGYYSNPSTSQYVFRCNSKNYTYTYDSNVFNLYPADALRISSAPFNPVATGVIINSTNFPDQNFRTYIAEEFDWDGDGGLSSEEIMWATYVDVYDMGISSLKGIEHLTAMDCLDCSNNRLTSLDLTSNPLLTDLNCSDNSLTSLNMSRNSELVDLDCANNQLTSLYVRQNKALEYLDCRENQLTSLDVAKNASLKYLYCETNRLTSLDVRQNSNLWTLSCSENSLTALDLSMNAKLNILHCRKNQLRSLDVTHNAALKTLDCANNQLSALNVRRNTRLSELDCRGNSLSRLDIANCPELVKIAGQNDYHLNYDSGTTTLKLHDNILRLPAQLTVIESNAFEGMAADVIEIPEGCTLIFGGAFANCPNLKDVRFPEACEASLHASAFGSARPTIVTASPTIRQWAEEHGFPWALE